MKKYVKAYTEDSEFTKKKDSIRNYLDTVRDISDELGEFIISKQNTVVDIDDILKVTDYLTEINQNIHSATIDLTTLDI